MKQSYVALITGLIFPTIVAIFAWFLGWITIPDDKLSIDYSYSTKPLFPSENNELLKSLKVSFQGKETQNLNISTIEFINQSSKNLDNLDIQIKWPKNYTLLSSSKNIPIGYSEKSIHDLYNPNESQITYNLQKFDRSNLDSDREIISFTLLFLGDAPLKEEIHISTSTKSIQFTDFDEKREKINTKTKIFLLIFFIIYLIILIISLFYANKKSKQKEIEYKEKMENYIKNTIIPRYKILNNSIDQEVDQTFNELKMISLSIYNPKKFKKMNKI